MMNYESQMYKLFYITKKFSISFINFAPCFNIAGQMKGLLYILLVVFLAGFSACGNKGGSKGYFVSMESSAIDSTLEKTSVRFVPTAHDFGQVVEGAKVVHVFEALNTGNADLLFLSVKPSCGCTTPKYDKKPIRPGKKGSIEVVFDTKKRTGKQRKTVLVVTNTEPSNTVLTFTCEVIKNE